MDVKVGDWVTVRANIFGNRFTVGERVQVNFISATSGAYRCINSAGQEWWLSREEYETGKS